jgi:hypothetical protein
MRVPPDMTSFPSYFMPGIKKTHNKECINKHKVGREKKNRLKEKHVRGGLLVDMQQIMPIQQRSIWK